MNVNMGIFPRQGIEKFFGLRRVFVLLNEKAKANHKRAQQNRFNN